MIDDIISQSAIRHGIEAIVAGAQHEEEKTSRIMSLFLSVTPSFDRSFIRSHVVRPFVHKSIRATNSICKAKLERSQLALIRAPQLSYIVIYYVSMPIIYTIRHYLVVMEKY